MLWLWAISHEYHRSNLDLRKVVSTYIYDCKLSVEMISVGLILGKAADIVTSQPKTRRKEVEGFLRDLDPLQVSEWSEADVIERFLKPIGMDSMGKAFMENKISGLVLMSLQEKHIKEMGCAILGDRILFMDYLRLLNKHKKDVDRSKKKSLWTLTTPVLHCAYHQNCGEFFFHLCCPCCVPSTEWRVTGQGIRWRKNRATLDCCGDIETQFIDYRFLKDLELRSEPKCYGFCVGKELLIYADDRPEDAVALLAIHPTKERGPDLESEPVSIMHPDVDKAESLIRNAWADAKLVSD